MFIRSERLFLRPGWPEDREELLRCMEQAAAGGPHPAADPLAGSSPRHPRFLVTLPGADGARVVGCVGFTPADVRTAAHPAATDFTCWIAEPFRGRGFGAEAGRAALAVARTIGHRRVGATLPEADPASLTMLDRLGFRPVPRESGWRGAMAASGGWLRDLGPRSDCDQHQTATQPVAAA
jgi:RimJ/RimL family protein N-acetyltransferase